ncbi:MAG: hypothetical protein IKX53_07700 [Bacteroidales bacterium]|nr:hypothetical protein [Bacteroidales bacterium]
MKQVLAFLMVLMCSTPLRAQLSLGSNSQPATPQAAEMTRYGEHGVNLYTGRVTVSIPIGEYRDKDFTVPIVLEYNYNGFRPNEQASEPGLGWMLSCGGMIVREVIGFPDEEMGHFYSYLTSPPQATPVLPFDDYPFSSSEPGLSFTTLGVSDSPNLALTALYAGTGSSFHDASSDIYHFRMPGHSGSFFRRSNGSFVVYDTEGESGTYRIEKQNRTKTDGEGGIYHCSRIVVTTGDGYRYVFGDLEEEEEYTEREWSDKNHPEKHGAIIAWRLREIVSPGGRTLSFYYEDHEDGRAVQYFAADRWFGYDGSTSGQELSGTSRYATYSPLTRIEGDGGTVMFHYSEKDSLHTGRFVTGAGIVALNPTFATRLLDSVTINDVVTHLSYTWNSNGNPYPFLSEVLTEGVGSWRMSYEGLAEGYFPPFWTMATDHWGYLNKTNVAQCNNSSVIWSNVSTLNGYQETLQGAKEPDTTAVRLGLLTTLSYPTGGSTSFFYGANRYVSAVKKNPSNSYYPDDLSASGYGPGVCIARIENRDVDGTVTDARSFTYGSGGRLLSWPRYQIHYGGTISGKATNVYYATTGSILRRGSVLLEYPSVTETRLDGSSTVRTFTDWTACPDEFPAHRETLQRAIPNGMNYTIGELNISSPGHLHNILEPLSSLQHFRGLPLSVAEYAAGDSSPLQTVSSAYNLTVPEYGLEYINAGDACAYVRRYAGEARATSRTEATRYGQQSVTVSTSYTYNSRGQVTEEQATTSQGDILRTVRTWPQDYPGDATLTAMTAANFVSCPVTEVQLRRRSGSSVWDTTAAVRYVYATHTNLLDSTFYTVSEVRRRQDTGVWVTEGAFLYDNNGNVVQQTDADGVSTSYIWNSVFGVSIIVENATRQQVESCLAQSPAVDITDTEAAAERLRSSLLQARVSDFDYQRYGLPTRMRDPAGHAFKYFYDANDRLVTIREDNAGILQQFDYNTVTR